MNENQQSKEILTILEVGEFLGICRTKAYELAKLQDFPCFRLGKTIKVRKTALLNWIEQKLEKTQ